ncbi:uncharacterized protein LOC119399688 isoform X2 [Rhipicephalus sanguineus]|uniref:uncharacterized protein LOC119399688 isoform X2 n=1 Tax=Rhipicephalus sanguineus TaxID=34632 RepID=UPI0020C385BF|nr:uncharacterized protein LOC119399688 isoform X2 [Rhipicephalus sanguineus]
MTLCLPDALFTYVSVFALSVSQSTAMDSEFCAVANGSGILCVNRTINHTLCAEEEPMVATTAETIKSLGEDISECEPPKYPLPASQNPLYLVGYSSSLNRSSYSCVASTFHNFSIGTALYRQLLLKQANSEKEWDDEIPVQLGVSKCSIIMNVSRTCNLQKRPVRSDST